MFSTRHRRLLLFSRDCYRALSTVAPRRVEPTDSFFWHAEVGRFPIEIPTTVDHSFYESYSAQLFKELSFEQEEQVDSVQVLPDDEILRIYGPPDLSQRFSQAVEHNDSHGVSKNFLLMSRKGYSTRHTVRDWITAAIKQNSDRHAIVKRWKTIATTAKSTEGVDILWEQLFTDKQSLPTPNLLDEVLSVLRQLENPPDTLAQLVCSLIRVEKSDLAMKIALKTSLVGYRLWRPLMRLKQQRDLKTVEKLAHILSETVVAELHQRKGPKTEQAPSPEKEALLVAVANFIGESSRRPTKRYKKPKRLRVKETALFMILEQIRDTWYGLAEDAAARERCNQWCSHNGVEPYPRNS